MTSLRGLSVARSIRDEAVKRVRPISYKLGL